MKRLFSLLLFLICAEPAISALPPQYQNMRDLDALKKFVQTHPKVASQLNYIDIRTYSIHYGDGCIVKFKRKEVIRLPGWVGPASPLVFSSSTCSVD